MSPDIEFLIHTIARVVGGDPEHALAIIAKAARDGKRQVTLPKSWSAGAWRVTVVLQTGLIKAKRRTERVPHLAQAECGPGCDQHAPF